MKVLTYLSAAALAMTGISAYAADLPKVEKPVAGKQVILTKISDNGKWAISETGSTTDGDLRPTGGVIYNMDTYEQTDISHSSGLSGVSDISNDGTIVVGECNGRPGYWTKGKGWQNVEMAAGMDLGRFNAVTPDGRYAVGYYTSSKDQYKAKPMAYDLKTGKALDLTGIPHLDMTHEDKDMNVFYGISPDGRYMVGEISQSYLMPTALCSYVYDRETQTYDFIGFQDYDDKPWVPDVPNLYFVDAPSMSNNGEWVTGFAYMVTPIPGSEWANEAYHTFLYNVKTKEFTLYSDSSDADISSYAVSNDGVVYGASPAQNPYAFASVRSGKYFITLEQIFRQVYNYDFNTVTGYANTGKVVDISNDGKTLIVLPNNNETYVLRMPEPLSEAAARVKLLGNYSATPTEGVKLSRLTNITLNFDRNLKLATNDFSGIKFAATDGSESYSPVATQGVAVDGKKLIITFRSRNLSDAKEYELIIPAGTVQIDGDADQTNEAIKISYFGRANTPVQMVSASPADESYLTLFDLTRSPLLLTFDAELKVVEGARGYFYRNDEETAFCMLNIAVSGNQALVYPTSGQNLYLDTDYHVVIPKGSLSDISGGGLNDEISLTFHGAYKREIVPDDKYLFKENCDDYSQMMFYEGDYLQPDVVPASWGFTKDTTPWLIVSDAGKTDMAFASHSMYSPVGQSDDWMVIPQILIPDANCYLEFDGQSYLFDTEDYIDVFIFESDNVYNTLTKDIISEIRNNGKHVMHQRLTPGESEDDMEGDWTNYKFDLTDYANKNIYIAFANLNADQSAVMLDNIHVVHENDFYTTFKTPARVVAQESVNVSGEVIFNNEFDPITSLELTLLDAEKTQIDRITESNVNFKAGDSYNFDFSKPLPLTKGETNTYFVEVKANNQTSTLTSTVNNLTFQPERKIVLEEYTGSECGNCPLGIRGMENIESIYPGSMIAVTIRTYQNDKLGTGMGAYSQALGLDNLGAPSAIIDRNETGYPMIQVEGDYRFSGVGVPNGDTGKDERLWLDIFRDRYESPAELGIELKSEIIDDTIDVSVQITNALNQYRANYNVFAVIIEDGLTTYQQNYMSKVTDPDLGEWGAGGRYGTPLVVPVEAHNVARATWGTTFNGTAGLYPTKMMAGETFDAHFTMNIPEAIENRDNCKVVVMVLDGGTFRVINANLVALNGQTGKWDGVETVSDSNEANVSISAREGKIVVNGNGNYNVAAYDIAGSALFSAKGNGLSTYALNGFEGVVIVKVTDANGNSKSAKLMVK
ncbi:MAG: Omp28-related outer membrane protein [Muribaculaceae bacterium]|nr:Omp28-related outer membrane protein [Muribaculaceae bacterium]MDE6446902.1 Omp28-related outer membrane protein [Muribaculaceae bacterium]